MRRRDWGRFAEIRTTVTGIRQYSMLTGVLTPHHSHFLLSFTMIITTFLRVLQFTFFLLV